jgi:glycine cleavage system H protein
MGDRVDASVRYRESHEWARKEGDSFLVGISDHAQGALGDIVFVELPAEGKSFKAGQAFGVIESVKAASDLLMPLGGTIVASNAALADAPDLVNKDPYGAGWMVRIRPDEPSEFDALLSPEAYAALGGEA